MSQQQQQKDQGEAKTTPDTETDPLDYLAINRARWDERAPHNAKSPSYHLARLISDPTFISPNLLFSLPLLPPLLSKSAIHLQSHIGTDTLSLARLGCSHVAGLDLSPASILEARSLVSQAAGGDKVVFVESDVYDAVEVLGGGQWDFVFTGLGALGWVPDVGRWARTVGGLLRRGGEVFLREGHPVLFSVGDEGDEGGGGGGADAAKAGLLVIREPYFESAGPIVCEQPSSFVRSEMGGKRELEARKTVEWNHGLGEVVSALLAAGMKLTELVEHKSVPWNALPGRMVEIGGGEWALKEGRDRMPLSYTLRATKE